MNPTVDIGTEKTVTIFPNPVVEKLHINTSFPIEKFAFYNSQGVIMLETTEMEVDCSRFSNGLYVGLIYFKEGGVERVSVLIER